jgi:Apea-like HEPN
MYTSYALVKFIDSRDSELSFRDFRIRQLSSVGDREDVRALFPGAPIYGTEWLYERTYDDSEVRRGAYGFGRIPGDLEDTLLLLRLFKPGNIVFIKHSIRDPTGALSIQFPQRIAGDMATTSFYKFSQAECDPWETFKSELFTTPSWTSRWFTTACRVFLYGGAKEFNPEWDEVDRIVDYMIALEATLVPEHGFGIGQRLRRRAVSLLGLRGDAANGANRVLRDLYEVRSTLVHGASLNDRHKKALQQMDLFESLIRQILTAGLRQIPPDENRRTQRLVDWYDVPLMALMSELFRLIKAIARAFVNRARQP